MMSYAPKVSIIIPAYNTEIYIGKAITSALSQTESSIEIIVVDDASTDNTAIAIKQISDPRLRFFQNEKNLGVSATRNRALVEAKGDWIAVLDSDDWYAPNRLEALLHIAEDEGADIIIDDLSLIQAQEVLPWGTLLGESGESISKTKQIDPVFYIETGLYGERGLHLGLCKPLFRRSFLNQHHISYDETLKVVEDFQLILRCLLQGAKMLFIPTPYYFYRSRPNSLVTQSKVKHIEQFKKVILEFLEQAQKEQNSELLKALNKSLSVLNKHRSYYSVIEPLKQKKIIRASIEAFKNPYFFIRFTSQIPGVIRRRYQYYFLGDKSVYEIARRKN